MPFSTAQTHCWAVLNFREWHLSSKSWSTCLLPKITTVQGYFSYNSSGFWLSLLLSNCLHITLATRLGELLVPTPSQPPKCSLGWKLCIYLAEEANIWSLSPPLLPLFYLRWNSRWPWVVFTKPSFFFKNFPWQFTPREMRNHPILVSAKWRDFWRLGEVAMLWIANFLKMLSLNSMCSDQSIDSYSSCHIVLAFQVLHIHRKFLYFWPKSGIFLHFIP